MEAKELIDKEIAGLGDWRGETLARIRKIVLAADKRIVEEWKWNTPVWTYKKNICAGGAFKDHVKINFFFGASLPDPKGLFNAGLEAKTSRAIDFREGDKLDEAALTDLVRAAIAQVEGK
jgi:hypothetical protein